MNKVLSISIAAYNVAATIKECLDPFLECGVLDDLDVMIVDDGSKDNTDELVQPYVDRYPDTFRLIKKQNGGWGSTVNTGIENAKGKFFRQLDGDDYYKPENMPAYIECLKNSEADMVVAPYITYSEDDGHVISVEDCNPQCEFGKVYRMDSLPTFAPFMHSITIKTERLRGHVKITEHCFYTDTEFVLKGCNQAETVEFFDKPIYCYRRATVGQSMSLQGMEKHYMDQTKVIDVMLQYLNEEVKRPEIKSLFDNLLWGTCCWQYLVMLYLTPSAQHKKDLVAYDKMLKKRAPAYYDRMDMPNLLQLRKLHFFRYAYYAKKQKAEDNRFSEDGRLLY